MKILNRENSLPCPASSPEVVALLNTVIEASRTSASESLFIVFDTLDAWMTEGKFSLCDEALRAAPLELLPNEVALGFLTITIPAKDKLEARVPLTERLTELYRSRSLDERKIAELLAGLE